MKSSKPTDWQNIRAKATTISPEAFAFVRDGLSHTVKSIHGEVARRIQDKQPHDLIPSADERFHVSGQQLCLGLRDLAIERYGLLARTVLYKWGVHRTEDFGVIVYSLIDQGELRCSDRDNIEDFAEVYAFDEAFEQTCLR